MEIKLYDGQRSPNARKVRLLCAELGINVDKVAPDFRKGELRTPEFLALNPNGKIPVIEDDGFVIWESGAILKYLAKKRPEAGLIPLDPKGLAKLDQWMFWWSAHVEPAFLTIVVEKLVKPFLGQPGNDEKLIGEATAQLGRFLPVLENEARNRNFLLGELCVFDFQAAPWLETASAMGIDMEPYPNLRAWLERMQQKPYWKET
jgi:glutathione S-transferase